MAYTSQSHLSGAAITAAHAENWETQYTEVGKTYFDRYSTASTGTSLLSVGSTFTTPTLQWDTIMYFQIPIGVQRSRLEFSATMQRMANVGNVYYSLFPSRHPMFNSGVAPGWHSSAYTAGGTGMALVKFQITTTAAAGETTSGSFSCIGGEYFQIGCENPTSSNSNIWNIKISGTSTTIEVCPTWCSWTTGLTRAPTSSG